MVEGRTHRPVIQSETCQTCNVCVRGCPAELIPAYRREKESLRGVLYRGRLEGKPSPTEVPFPPCQEACPIHQDARGYVGLIAKGKFREALELIREVNPLPAVCGFICHHPCEEACLRADVDDPVPMRLMKRFVAEHERGGMQRIRKEKKKRQKVLVVGSGPAGLTAANDLSLLGYEVTIHEALPVLGGMLSVGIPAYRLPRDILDMEIEGIKALGVEMKTDHFFSLDGNGRSFRKLGFQAVFLSTGAHGSMKLKIPGEGLREVYPGVAFLRDMNLGKKVKIGNKVVVIGGGNVALDVARSALGMGAKKVEIYYRRSRDEMPAIREEVEEAIQEGVKIRFLVSPLRIIGKGGKAVAMGCTRMRLGEPDRSGRRKPIPIEGSSFDVQADTIIAAIGQKIDRKGFRGLETNEDGTVRVHPGTGETSLKGVFAGGDVVRGPGWAIDAIADGKRGAQSIHQYLS